MKLANKVAIVTGANKTAEEINDQGGKAMGVSMNVTDETQVNTGVDAAVEAYGRVDILVSNAGIIIFMGSVHSKEASKLKVPYVTAKHGLIGLCKVIAKEGAEYGVRCNVICPGFVRTPLVDKQIPEQARTLGISEEDVIKKVMLGETVDGVFTTVADITQVALLFAEFETNAQTGQSLVASHGWFMQ